MIATEQEAQWTATRLTEGSQVLSDELGTVRKRNDLAESTTAAEGAAQVRDRLTNP